jgi:putative transposase
MQRRQSTEEQIIGVLPEHEAGVKVADLCPKHGSGDATFYNRKSKYSGLTVSDAARLRAFGERNQCLQKVLDHRGMADGRPHYSSTQQP